MSGLERLDALAREVAELAAEMRFQTNLAALGSYAIRPHEPQTIGSQLHEPRPNPHYRPEKPVPPKKRPPRKRKQPPAQVVTLPAPRQPWEPQPVAPIRYGHRDGRTAAGAIPAEPRRPP